ncbi:MAG: intradiol ring-cleavage dioxygenase, partial [Chitinophagaceae bacterium]
MKQLIFLLLPILNSCNAQNQSNTKLIGGGCDGCELMYIGMPVTMKSTDTSAGWTEAGQKLLVTGKVLKPDGRTPASNVIVYYWQTDNNGYYSPTPGLDLRVNQHGHIRGWIKTDSSGKYNIYTIRPAPYPDRHIPAHIHLSIKEPQLANEYYTDEINFDDDKLLLPHLTKYPQEKRGGSGIVRVLKKDSLQIAEHNITLGLNIPGYPDQPAHQIKTSGLNIGEDQPSFTPFHAFGPDKGSTTCPVCKYGRYHGVIFYVGNKPNWIETREWLRFLEQESVVRKKYLKVYFVY